MMFCGKAGELALKKAMKKKFILGKKSHSYAITSIFDLAVKVATQILAGKVMRKSHSNEESMLIIA